MTTPGIPSVVIVEDSDEDSDTVREAVRHSELAVDLRRAASGGECLRLLRGGAVRPALVVMDLNTPGTDGREALTSLKADPALRSIPVVVLSTSNSPGDVAFCYAAGANAYHVKPVRYAEHLRVLGDLLGYWLGPVTLPEGVRSPQ